MLFRKEDLIYGTMFLSSLTASSWFLTRYFPYYTFSSPSDLSETLGMILSHGPNYRLHSGNSPKNFPIHVSYHGVVALVLQCITRIWMAISPSQLSSLGSGQDRTGFLNLLIYTISRTSDCLRGICKCHYISCHRRW